MPQVIARQRSEEPPVRQLSHEGGARRDRSRRSLEAASESHVGHDRTRLRRSGDSRRGSTSLTFQKARSGAMENPPRRYESRPSAWDLAQIVSKPVFKIPWLVKAACVQCLY